MLTLHILVLLISQVFCELKTYEETNIQPDNAMMFRNIKMHFEGDHTLEGAGFPVCRPIGNLLKIVTKRRTKN